MGVGGWVGSVCRGAERALHSNLPPEARSPDPGLQPVRGLRGPSVPTEDGGTAWRRPRPLSPHPTALLFPGC